MALESIFGKPYLRRQVFGAPAAATSVGQGRSLSDVFSGVQGARGTGAAPAGTAPTGAPQPNSAPASSSLASYLGAPSPGAGIGDFPRGPQTGPAADYRNDPVLLQIRAGNQTVGANADSAALAARRQLLTQFGDIGIARATLGDSDPVLGAVSDNPDTSTSILARLRRGYRDTVSSAEQDLNKANLGYSSTRGRVLGDLAKDDTTSRADAISTLQQALAGVSAGQAATKQGALQSDQTAEADAYQRFLAAVAANPSAFAALSGGSGAGHIQSGGLKEWQKPQQPGLGGFDPRVRLF